MAKCEDMEKQMKYKIEQYFQSISTPFFVGLMAESLGGVLIACDFLDRGCSCIRIPVIDRGCSRQGMFRLLELMFRLPELMFRLLELVFRTNVSAELGGIPPEMGKIPPRM